MNKKGVMDIKYFIKIFCFILCLFTMIFSITMISVHAHGWGFTRNNNHELPDIGKYASEIEGTNSYYVGNSNEKTLYLTFDAGYDNGIMQSILHTLNSKNIKASFFITGDFVKRFPDLVLAMTRDGHTIANHSYTHKSINHLSNDEIQKDLEKLEKVYNELTGLQMVKCFRPPKGDFNRESLLYISKLGYKTIFWSMAHFDWDTEKQMSVSKTKEIVLNNIHNGAIILLHSVSSSNAEALPSIIDQLISEGYSFSTVDLIS